MAPLLTAPARLAGASLLRLQSDERLVAAVRAGHEDAFTAVVHRYRAPLLRYCTRLVGADRAEDGLQQAFINAHAAMTTKDQDIELRPWLYRLAHNASLNVLRAGAAAEGDGAAAERASLVDTAEAVELRDRLRRTLDAIEQLPASQRDALLLHAIEGRSHEQVAEALDIGEGAARQAVHRARSTLRAAVTAVTPWPLVHRLLQSGGDGSRWVEAIAGGGIAAAATKIGAGVAATAAIAGGAFEAGVIDVEPLRADADRPAQTTPQAAAAPADSTSPIAVAPVVRVAAVTRKAVAERATIEKNARTERKRSAASRDHRDRAGDRPRPERDGQRDGARGERPGDGLRRPPRDQYAEGRRRPPAEQDSVAPREQQTQPRPPRPEEQQPLPEQQQPPLQQQPPPIEPQAPRPVDDAPPLGGEPRPPLP